MAVPRTATRWPTRPPTTPPSSTTPPAPPALAKGILHAHRYLLAHEEFEFCHDVRDGELFHGSGEWAWAAGICPLLGPWRYGAVALVQARKGGYDPEEHLALPLEARRAEHVHHADRAAGDDRRGRRRASATRSRELRITCSAGEPLNPEVIRWFRDQYGITVLDYYGLTESYPLCGNFPTVEVREGSMGRPVPGWEVAILDEDEQPLGVGERGEICLRARSNPHYPLGYWNRPEEDTREVFGGDWFHTKDAAETRRGRLRLVRGPRGRRDHLRRLPDRAVRGRVGVRGAPRGQGGGGGGVTRRAPRRHREGVHRARARAHGSDELADLDQAARARAPLGLRLSARDRVRGRPAEDADREDPPGRAARAASGSGRRPRSPSLPPPSSASSAAMPTLWPWASVSTAKVTPGTSWAGWVTFPPSCSAFSSVAGTSSTLTKNSTSSSAPWRGLIATAGPFSAPVSMNVYPGKPPSEATFHPNSSREERAGGVGVLRADLGVDDWMRHVRLLRLACGSAIRRTPPPRIDIGSA